MHIVAQACLRIQCSSGVVCYCKAVHEEISCILKSFWTNCLFIAVLCDLYFPPEIFHSYIPVIMAVLRDIFPLAHTGSLLYTTKRMESVLVGISAGKVNCRLLSVCTESTPSPSAISWV